MIVLADANRLWCVKPFSAVHEFESVIGLCPTSFPWKKNSFHNANLNIERRLVFMPPGWASIFSTLSAIRLRQAAARMTKSHSINAWVFTSPHYVKLNRMIRKDVRTIYYCSDDFLSYEQWNASWIKEREAELVAESDHSVFVSNALAQRAIDEYGVSPSRVSVIPNATDESFLRECRAPIGASDLVRPVVGVVGVVNDRIDASLLKRVSSLSEVGTLLIVGKQNPEQMQNPDWVYLNNSDKCVFVGECPHSEIPSWMKTLDLALIPYAKTTLNYYCSPLRLYDHLACGVPIVGTGNCEQIYEFREHLLIGEDGDEFLSHVQEALSGELQIKKVEALEQLLWKARANRLMQVVRPSA